MSVNPTVAKLRKENAELRKEVDQLTHDSIDWKNHCEKVEDELKRLRDKDVFNDLKPTIKKKQVSIDLIAIAADNSITDVSSMSVQQANMLCHCLKNIFSLNGAKSFGE